MDGEYIYIYICIYITLVHPYLPSIEQYVVTVIDFDGLMVYLPDFALGLASRMAWQLFGLSCLVGRAGHNSEHARNERCST